MMPMDEAEMRADSDLRALMEAQRVKKDKTRLKAAMELAKKQRAMLDDMEEDHG